MMIYFRELRNEVHMKIKYYGDIIEKNKMAISLCGPTPRNNKTKSWRKEALEILQKLDYNGIVYVPESKDGLQVFKTKEEQMIWERECYINCTK